MSLFRKKKASPAYEFKKDASPLIQLRPLSDRVYKCGHCHADIDRDLNAAINIRREAERLYAEA